MELLNVAYTPQWIMGGIADSEVLIQEVLQQNGYATKLIGKWHLGHLPQFHPMKHGFDEYFGAPNCHFVFDDKSRPNIPVYNNEMMIGRYYDQISMHNHVSNYTQMLKKAAISFIVKRAPTGKPFFLYFAPDASHGPVYSSEKFHGASRRGLYIL